MNLAALLFDVARRVPEAAGRHRRPACVELRIWRNASRRVAGGCAPAGCAGDGCCVSGKLREFFELLFGCWAAGCARVPANARLHPREVRTSRRIPAPGCCRDAGSRAALAPCPDRSRRSTGSSRPAPPNTTRCSAPSRSSRDRRPDRPRLAVLHLGHHRPAEGAC